MHYSSARRAPSKNEGSPAVSASISSLSAGVTQMSSAVSWARPIGSRYSRATAKSSLYAARIFWQNAVPAGPGCLHAGAAMVGQATLFLQVRGFFGSTKCGIMSPQALPTWRLQVPDTGQDPAYNSRSANRGVTLYLLPAASVVALVPTCAVICGALAARDGRWPFQVVHATEGALDPRALTALVLAVFIVQVLWSTGQALLIDGDASPIPPGTASDRSASWASGPRRGMPGLPYTTPWSPLGRLIGRWRAPSRSPGARLTLVLVPLLAMILSAVTGWQMTVLSLAAIALSLLEWRVARQGCPHSALQAGTLVGLGWLAGHTVFAPLTWTSLTMACCYAIAYQGALELDREDAWPGEETCPGENRRLPWALTLLYGGQGAALVLLVVLGRPLVATLSGLLLAPQWLLLAQLAPRPADAGLPDASSCSRHPSSAYIRHAVPFVMVAMLAAAWAISA
jgi:hypothetical protein